MISFDIEKNGYNKEQVTKYFDLVQKEYEGIYAENQALRSQLQQTRQFADAKPPYDIPHDRMEAIALALIDAEVEAQRIVSAARDKAWQIITDAQKGLPMAEAPAKPSLPVNSVEVEETEGDIDELLQATDDIDALVESMDDIDKWIESMISENRSGGD